MVELVEVEQTNQKGKWKRTPEQETLRKRIYRKKIKEEKNALMQESIAIANQVNKQKIVCNLVFSFKRQVGRLDLEEKREVLHDFLKHKEMKDITVDHLKSSEVKSHLIESIRESIQNTKRSTSLDSMAARRSVLAMTLGKESLNQTISKRSLGKVLGVHPRCIAAAKEKRKEVEFNKEGWVFFRRSRRFDSLDKYVIELVESFWDTNTRVSPNVKDVKFRRLERNVREEHATHYLEDTQSQMFIKFKEQYPQITIGQRAFEKLKPWYVMKLKQFNSCCCIHHVRLQMLLDGLNSLRNMHVEACNCACDVCHCTGQVCAAKTMKYKSTTQLWQSILCSKEENQEFHKKDCINGDCEQCGVSRLPVCPLELSEEGFVSWEYWDYEEGGKDKWGKPKKVLQRLWRKTKPKDLMHTLIDRLAKFPLHNFRHKWQAMQFREMLDNLPFGVVVSVVDFAENFTIQLQDQVQSAYWTSKQVTILVHITYYLDPISGDVIKDAHYYISDDTKHDTLFVQHAFMMHAEFMKEQGIHPKKHWVFSDGAASQFKAARPFYFVGRYSHETLIEMMWNFFGSNHGKGEHDGKAAELKRWLRELMKRSQSIKIECAADIVSIAKENFSNVAPSSSVKKKPVTRWFWEVTNVDRKNAWGAETVEDTRNLHSVHAFNLACPTQLHVRRLSCFCAYCLDAQWEKCLNKEYVDDWELIVIEPSKVVADEYELRRSERTLFGDSTKLSDLVREGDNFVVAAPKGNEEGSLFWVLLCTKEKYVVQADFEAHGNSFYKGEEVLEGTYYRQVPKSLTSYKLCSKEPKGIVYASQVCAIRLDMTQAKHKVKGKQVVYKLCEADSEKILDNLPDVLSDEED